MLSQDIELEWPSKRIPQGGVLHNAKIRYGPDVKNLMQVLAEESKLTLAQKRQVDWCLRNGKPLIETEFQRQRSTKSVANRRPTIPRRRSLSAIVNSGAFEREKFNPKQRVEDREVVKRQLQEIMEFGKLQTKLSKITLADKKEIYNSKPSDEEIFNRLLLEIKERVEWLEEMESLGEGHKHRDVIHNQIAERMRQIEKLNRRFNPERLCE